jgi:hypothetical protein
MPGLWLYGAADRSQPTADDVDVLTRLRAEGKDFTVLIYPDAGHGLLDVPPSDPRALPQVVQWIERSCSRGMAPCGLLRITAAHFPDVLQGLRRKHGREGGVS